MSYNWAWDQKTGKTIEKKKKKKYPKGYDYNSAIKEQRESLSESIANLSVLMNKITPIVEEAIKKKETEEKDKKIIKENKKKAEKLSKAIRNIGKVSNNPLENALKSSKKYAKEMYMKRGTSEDTDGLNSKFSHLAYAGTEIIESSLNFVSQSAQFAYNRYTSLQEDYMTAQTVTNVRDTINRVKQAGNSIISGMATGAATGGVVGAVIGGVTNAIDFGVNQYFEYQQRMSSYYQQLNATNYQTSFDSTKLGLINNSRGTEN